MTQTQFHNKVEGHYRDAAKEKRNHPINYIIESMRAKLLEARTKKEEIKNKIAKGKANTHDLNEFHFFDGVIDASDREVLGLDKVREQLFSLMDEDALRSVPVWNGRELLREEIDFEKMLEILAGSSKWTTKNFSLLGGQEAPCLDQSSKSGDLPLVGNLPSPGGLA